MKAIKGLFITVLLLLNPLMCFSQQSDWEKLNAAVEQLNNVLPVSTEKGVTLTQYYIQDGNVVVVNEVDEEIVDFNLYTDKKQKRKKILLNSYKNTPALRKFAKLVTRCNMGILVVYKGIHSGHVSKLLLNKKALRQSIK